MTLLIDLPAWKNGDCIPSKFAFAAPATEEHVALSDNLNPELRWSGAPDGTKSFAFICHDPDVPSSAEDVNQEGKVVAANIPRIDFFHWVVVDIPASVTAIAEGEDSDGVTAKGKRPSQKPYGVTVINSYTDWFANDAQMGGDYGGYDGPCPPWNDAIVHHYHFTIYALDVAKLGLKGAFTGTDALRALSAHVLAKASHVGTYTLNPNL